MKQIESYLSPSGWNLQSKRVESWVQQGGIKGQTRSFHGSNKVESWVE